MHNFNISEYFSILMNGKIQGNKNIFLGQTRLVKSTDTYVILNMLEHI